jgi:hypothetical protein
MWRALANKQSEQCRCMLEWPLLRSILFVESIEGQQCAYVRTSRYLSVTEELHTPHMHPSPFPLRIKCPQPPTQVCDSVQTWVRKRPQFHVGRAQGEECPNHHALSKGSSGRSHCDGVCWCASKENSCVLEEAHALLACGVGSRGLTCEGGCARFAAVVFTLKLHPVFVALQALREALQFPSWERPRLVTSQIVISQRNSKNLLFD